MKIKSLTIRDNFVNLSRYNKSKKLLVTSLQFLTIGFCTVALQNIAKAEDGYTINEAGIEQLKP
ncbi:MAG: hypothetical protein HC908_11030 [Calothrix sp. SM1_7_51]|nr:hypothetical protein [Calothrix sp. SM1_7_51]